MSRVQLPDTPSKATDQLPLWGGEPADGLQWSLSRAHRLRECPRKYYFHHYGSRGGQNPEAPPEVRELFMLKALKNRYMWVGIVVHNLIEKALDTWRRGEEVGQGALVARGTRTMRAQYAESLQGMYRDRPMQATGLVEHEYYEEVSRDEWRAQRDHMERCVRAFFELDIVKKIRRAPAWRWLGVETFGRFALDGAKVIVRPDFALRDSDESIIIVDWKTGLARPDSEDMQLAVYGLYARQAWGLRQDHLRGAVAYLGAAKHTDSDTALTREVILGDDDLANAETVIKNSLREMRQLLPADADPQPDAFPLTTDKTNCARCPFRRPCGRT